MRLWMNATSVKHREHRDTSFTSISPAAFRVRSSERSLVITTFNLLAPPLDSPQRRSLTSPPPLLPPFPRFQTVFNKTYADDQESRFRFLVFKDNLKS